MTPQRYCGFNHSADFGVQKHLSDPGTEVFSSGSYSLVTISNPDTRGNLGHYPFVKVDQNNSDWVTLPEVRVGTDLSDLATELNVCSSTVTA